MKKIIFLIWADAKNYQTLIFMAQFFSKEGKDVNIIHRESLNSTLGPIDFGKKNFNKDAQTKAFLLKLKVYSGFNFKRQM